MNIVKRCVMNCSPREGKPPCEDCEAHDTDIVQVWFDKATHCVMPIPTISGEHISHTLGGFKGAFVVENGARPPTEQEIWNAGVRSGMERAKQELGWRDMGSAPRDGTELWLYEGDTTKKTWRGKCDETGQWVCGAASDDKTVAWMMVIKPTKWMNLPPAPKE